MRTALTQWEVLAELVLRAWLVHLAALVQLDRRDRWDLPDHRANRDPLAQPGLVAPDPKVQPVRKVRLARLVLPVQQVRKAQQVQLALPVRKAQQARPVHKVQRVLTVLMVLKVQPVLKVLPVLHLAVLQTT